MKLSVVIPCYNAERFVEKCIASCIVNNIAACDCEIICVDDCSSDGTLAVLEALAAKNPRLVIIRHDVNKGTNEARRSGVIAATGDYILFCDADDSFEPHALDRIAEQLQSEPVDVLFFGHRCVWNQAENNDSAKGLSTKARFYEGDNRYEGPVTQDAIMSAMFCRRPKLLWHVWGRAWARSIVLKGFGLLPQSWGCLAEDGCESLAFLIFAKTFGFLHLKLYRYQLEAGITGQGKPTAAKASIVLRSAEFILEFCDNLCKQYGGLYSTLSDAIKDAAFADIKECHVEYLIPDGKELSQERLTLIDNGRSSRAILFFLVCLFNDRTRAINVFAEDRKLGKKYVRWLRLGMDIDMFFVRDELRRNTIKRMRDALKSLYQH